MRKIHRFGMVIATVAVLLLLLLCTPLLIDRLGGDFDRDPEDGEWLFSEAANALIQASFEGIEPGTLRDYHTHLLGLGEDPHRAYVHEHSFSWLHPLQLFRNRIYLSAAGVTDRDQADARYLARLVRLIRATPGFGRYHLLAYDKHYLADGTVDESRTRFYVSNEYVFEVAERYPDLFIPVASIHPYREDAIAALNKWASKGVRMIKWLPNAQGIDPADPRLLPFYEAMQAHGMVLLTHTGEEKAVEAGEQQDFGNPLLLRQPLGVGVKVIAAHAASLGAHPDLDDPDRPIVPAYKLLLRLMDEKRYDGLLFAEISAITMHHRAEEALLALLQRPDLHHRLVNGSDYPVSAVNMLISLDQLSEMGVLDETLQPALREIYHTNPLLFDFVLKRSLRLPSTDLGFDVSVFTTRSGLHTR